MRTRSPSRSRTATGCFTPCEKTSCGNCTSSSTKAPCRATRRLRAANWMTWWPTWPACGGSHETGAFAAVRLPGGVGAGALRAYSELREPAGKLADLLGQLPGPPFFAAAATDAGKRFPLASEVGVPDSQTAHGGLAAGGGRGDVPDRSPVRGGGGRAHRPQLVDLGTAAARRLADHRLRPHQPRRGHSRRHAL